MFIGEGRGNPSFPIFMTPTIFFYLLGLLDCKKKRKVNLRSAYVMYWQQTGFTLCVMLVDISS